jgi:hypothetical protein
LKVALVIEAGFICSEKVALTLAPRADALRAVGGARRLDLRRRLVDVDGAWGRTTVYRTNRHF